MKRKKQLTITIIDDVVTICRERPVTKDEKKIDPKAELVVEVVTVRFSDDDPEMVVNRNLCGAAFRKG